MTTCMALSADPLVIFPYSGVEPLRSSWNRRIAMKTDSAEDEEVMRKIDALMKDPEKWKEYVASRAERAIRHWPKR